MTDNVNTFTPSHNSPSYRHTQSHLVSPKAPPDHSTGPHSSDCKTYCCSSMHRVEGGLVRGRKRVLRHMVPRRGRGRTGGRLCRVGCPSRCCPARPMRPTWCPMCPMLRVYPRMSIGPLSWTSLVVPNWTIHAASTPSIRFPNRWVRENGLLWRVWQMSECQKSETARVLVRPCRPPRGPSGLPKTVGHRVKGQHRPRVWCRANAWTSCVVP